ncbi:hypothetical protein [Brachybacterium muris]|uniref:hypothetical protein n=1 Tax=Brachybacterium muris TaxID=219301 RepID=UPI00223C3A75|nr:hypothetical protein [Brachybacterium muris]
MFSLDSSAQAAPRPRLLSSRPGLVIVLLLARAMVLALVMTALAPPAARADGPVPPAGGPGAPAEQPVRLVLATAGLSWEDIDPERTPALQCLADNAGVGAMNTTSTTVVSTKRQGMETLRTGYRGLAALAPRTAGIPNPPTDQWQQLDAPVVEVDATGGTGDAGAENSLASAVADQMAGALDDGAVVLVDVGSVPDHDDPARAEAVSTLDARVEAVLEAAGVETGGVEAGTCDVAALPRTLLLSVAATDPPASQIEEVERTGAVASRTVGLQVAMDTAFPGQALTSGASKQTGVVVLTDALATVLTSHDASPQGLIPGQPFRGVDHADPQQLALDRSQAAAAVDAASVPALGSWFAMGLIGAVLLLIPATARRPGVAAVARAAASVAPLPLAVGLFASLVPWWRADSPALALTGVVWAGSALLAVVCLAGPWRRHRFGPAGVAATLVAALVLLESATGSRFQLGSPLGAQPISGGRFYGLSNHLFGLVLAASLMALLCLFTVVRTARARMLWTLGAGAVVAIVCVAPSMGADFGSMVTTVPVFGLLALLVSRVRVRLWHLLLLGVGGAVAVLGVSFLDWLRPAEDRTHLGRFIDELLSGELLAVIIRKLSQNVAMVTGYWQLGVLMLIAIVLSVVVLMPRRLGLRRLVRLDEAHPASYPVRVALVVGAWLGYAVNDTGPVLVAAMLAVWVAQLPAVLPDPEPSARPASEPEEQPGASSASA